MSRDVKRWLALAAVLAVAVVAAYLVFVEPERQRLRFRQVQYGMPRDEVIAIMGTGPNVTYGHAVTDMIFPDESERWKRSRFFIAFNEEGRVAYKSDNRK
jgi:hypothetical protein